VVSGVDVSRWRGVRSLVVALCVCGMGKLNLWLLALMLVVFTFLTSYSA